MGRRRKEKKILENVRIAEMAAEGKCLAHGDDGKVIFVPFTAPGDVVDIQLGRSRKAYAEGRVLNYKELSPSRIDPRCEHFGVCGGCKWQHLPYSMQLEMKQKQVYDQLLRIGKLELNGEEDILASENIYAYRNKLEFTFSNKRWFTEEEIASGEADSARKEGLGFHIPRMFDKVLDIEECHLQVDISNKIRNFVKAYCLEHPAYTFFDIREQEGLMRNLVIRSSSTGELMVLLIFYKDQKEEIEALLSALLEAFRDEISTLLYIVNPKCNDTYNDLEVQCYHGPGFIMEQMEDLSFKIGPKSFYQTNSDQAYRLYSVVRQFAGLTGNEMVYDLYTGTGTIACFLARSAAHVVGIEYVEPAVIDARENAERNGLNNLSFFAGDMKDILTDDFISEHGRPDLIVTDPPRAGMHADVVETILRAAPKTIVYVSCNPATQARDLAMMKEDYEVLAVQPVDMFPHTQHVENIVKLSLRKN